MLQVSGLNYSIGDRQLLANVDWVIQPGKRTALIGPNGAGKTTMLRILVGQLDYDSGKIVKPNRYRIGYLPQEELEIADKPVLETVLEAQHELKRLENRLHELLGILGGSGGASPEILEEVGDLQHRFEALGGYHMEAEAKKILSGLGFRSEDFNRNVWEFSGGWQMRVHLARLLLLSPDLLLLDEPTNHLDLPSLEWLEQYLLGFKGSIVMVSHDRFFIDRLAQDIVELDRGKLIRYAGNYHFYEREKELRESLLRKKIEEQKLERERQERFINRFRYKNTKASQVQSRIKMLEKMEKLEDLPPAPPKVDFSIKVDTTSYRDVLTIEDMSFRYAEDWVLRTLNMNVSRGEKIAMVGVNGAGKTTLTRLIVGQLGPREGRVQLGSGVKVGYYAQHQVEALDLDATAYDEICSTVATSQVPLVRDVLGIFQITGADVYKRVGVLSGGEKARVSLSKILLSPVNFLVMDEPTNHLDKFSRQALEDALVKYDGTLILISHDRYFLDKIVSRVVELSDGQLTEYIGNYTDYLDAREKLKSPAENGFSKQKAMSESKLRKELRRLKAEARQAVSKERSRINRDIEALEKKIEEMEARKKEVENQMTQPETYDDGLLTIKLQKEYALINKNLDESMGLWENRQAELAELLRKIPD